MSSRRKQSLPQSGEWITAPAYYVRTPKAARSYRRFPGARPYSNCHQLSQSSCKKRQRQTMECLWVPSQKYCRGNPGSVSASVPRGKSAFYKPAYDQGQSKCQGIRNSKQCGTTPQCRWIPRDKLGRQPFCQGVSGTAEPASTRYASLPREQGFRPSGRFDSHVFSDREKDQWYRRGAPMSEAERKQCRCLLERSTGDIMNNKELVGNTYGICQFAVAGAARTRGRPSAETALRSQLAKSTRSRQCTQYADFDAMPTSILYGYIKLHQKTTTGLQYFPTAQVPDFDTFMRNMDKYRPLLLSMVRRYQNKTKKQKQ